MQNKFFLAVLTFILSSLATLAYASGPCDEAQNKFIADIRDHKIPKALKHYREIVSPIQASDFDNLVKWKRQIDTQAVTIKELQKKGRSVYEKYDQLYAKLPQQSLELQKLQMSEELEHQDILKSMRKEIELRNINALAAKMRVTQRLRQDSLTQKRGLAALEERVGIDLSGAIAIDSSSDQGHRFPYAHIEMSLAENNQLRGDSAMNFPILVVRIDLDRKTVNLQDFKIALAADQAPLSLEAYSQSILSTSCQGEASSLDAGIFHKEYSLR